MTKIHGDTKSIKKSVLEELEKIYEMTVPHGQPLTAEMALLLGEITCRLNKEIAIYLNRRGEVAQVALGDSRTVPLPAVNGRKSMLRLSGIRLIHTHPNGSSRLSNVDLASLKEMRFDLVAALGVAAANEEKRESLITDVSFAYISDLRQGKYETLQSEPLPLAKFLRLDFNSMVNQIEGHLGTCDETILLAETERAFLVGIEPTNENSASADSLAELKSLAETAGAQVIDIVTQRRAKRDTSTYIGKGKLEEINLLRQAKEANLIIVDDELTLAQKGNMEQALGIKVVDRAELILDIFAQRARSYEGKLQVELAQLKYALPRLTGKGLVLSRLGGGIGTRGPGETKLEVDRRRMRERISEIQKEIENLKKHRALHRQQRQKARIPVVSLIGYTNTGKSTLLNKLTNADVLAENKLFATLDPTTRKFTLPSGREILLTDTVGFIRKLPHQLIDAFRSTLEEVLEADLLLHVIDAGHPDWQAQSEAVFTVLRELKADDKPILTVFNKIDRQENPHILERMLRTEPESIGICARAKTNFDQLLAMIDTAIMGKNIDTSLVIPYSESALIAKLHASATVEGSDYGEDGVYLKVSIPAELWPDYQKYALGSVDKGVNFK